MEKLAARASFITFGVYTDALRVSAAFAKALGHALFYAMPSDADERERAAVQLVVERGDAIDRILDARQDTVHAKVEFGTFGRCWGGLYDALVAKTRLPATMSRTAPTAARLIETIFPDGILFIRLRAPAAWADGDRRYKRIVELGLEGDIATCIGDEYVPAAHLATVALGEAIGTAKARRAAPSRTGLADALRLFSRAVRRYCRVLAANVEEDDAASVERFRKAVLPIDAYRRSVRARGGIGRNDDADPAPRTPADPTPPRPPPRNGDGPFLDEPTPGE